MGRGWHFGHPGLAFSDWVGVTCGVTASVGFRDKMVPDRFHVWGFVVVKSMQRMMSRGVMAVAGSLVAAGFVLVPSAPAAADTAPADPADPATPRTVSTDPLPTVQINGVVWSQVVLGNRVYVGGEFTQARPAGAAPGTNQTARANLLAYDIRTGQLINSWVADTNGTVNAVTASPDGSRIYAGGTFTTVNGLTYRRIVALDPSTGAVIPGFSPNPDSRVRAISATRSTVYFGGSFGRVGGLDRGRLAAARASDGAVLDWAPVASATVDSILVSPDQTQVLVGGTFTTLNGSSNPGYGLGAVDAVTGALRPWAANSIVRNATPQNSNAAGSITALTTRGNSVYANGYTWQRAGGNLEGTVKMSWDGGTIQWLEDCHGDSYGNYPVDGIVYVVAHKHYCGNLPSGFPQNDTWRYRRATAFVDRADSVLRQEYNGYSNFEGTPAPSLLHWFPEIDSGDYTGQGQGAWAVTGNDDYVVAGGEFPRVERQNQQGLVRFARPGIAPNNELFDDNGSNTNPTVRAVGAGQVLISWKTNFDRDNADITYRIIRNGNNNNPIETRTVSSTDWNEPYESFLDRGATPGSTATYRLFTSDPWGNETRSDTISVDVPSDGDADAYARSVVQDGPKHFWRFSEGSGSTVAGYTGLEDGTLTGDVTRGVEGAISGDSAARFNGGAWMYNSTPEVAPFFYSVEAWFNTTTTSGGKLVGYGNRNTATSSSSTSDHALYMDNSGRILFGSRQGSSNRTVQSGTGLNNGQWHQAVGVQGPDGMALFVDGVRVGQRNDTRAARAFEGYWRVGGDTLSGWANRPSSDSFNGSIDEVAVYTHPLTGNRVRAHYLASSRALGAVPTAGYGQAVYDSGPDLYWRLAETGGTTAADSSLNGSTGTYLNGPTLGGTSAVGEADDRSVGFDGSNDTVASSASQPGLREYSAETWFRTTSSSGGRIFGFGSSQNGSSSATDRNVYLTDTGRIRFGTVFNGVEATLVSPTGYRDGAWHHVVATQGASGMALYVDGARVANNGVAINSTFSGFWRIGGDNLAGWTDQPTSSYLDGSLDEAAVYGRVLRDTEVAAHFAAGGGAPANQPPVADFSSSVTNLAVSFSSAGSTDRDGTIASRAWDFGDGATSTQVNPNHTYAAAGTFPVKLTVTDDQGASASVTKDVTVSEAPNQAPTATFTATPTALDLSVDASVSEDPDGTVASYAWNWGDSTPSGNGVTASHTYASGGTYTVTLTVTDDDGATDQTTRSVTVTQPGSPSVVVSDQFGRSVASGWGSADTGGAWTTTGPANRWSVAGGQGVYTAPAAGRGNKAFLDGVSVRDLEGGIDVSMDKAVTGSGILWTQIVRRDGDTYYQFVTRIQSGGDVRAWISRVVSGSETEIADRITVPGGPLALGDRLRIKFAATGAAPTALQLKVWKIGSAEPTGWSTSASDSTTGLQDAGSVGLYTYLFGSATNAPVETRFDNFGITSGGGGGPAPNQVPTASFTATPSDLAVNVNASASDDADGTVASYEWGWGDGTPAGSGVTASHTYGAAGTYTVTLTVTDDDGAKDQTTRSVTVTNPGSPTVLAADLFERLVSAGWGSADTGGAWTTTGPNRRWSIAGGRGVYTAEAAGRGNQAFLQGISRADVSGLIDVSMDKPITGTGVLWTTIARRNGNSYYQFVTRIQTGGEIRAWISRVVNGSETEITPRITVPGGTFAAGDTLRVRYEVTGSGPAALRMKVWKVGTSEPADWSRETTDATTELAGAGNVGLYTYLFGSATNAPVQTLFDNLRLVSP